MKNLRIALVVVTALNILGFILSAYISGFAGLIGITYIANISICGFLASKLRRRAFLWVIGAIFIPVIIPLVLVFQKEAGESTQYQALRVKASSSSDKQVVINKFKTAKAAVKAQFDINSLVESLDNYLVKRFSEKGYQVVEKGKDCLTIDGSFILINEGNQFIRYLTGWGGNTIFDSAKIEVEGTITKSGAIIKNFHIVDKGYAGLQAFGGSGQKILINATKSISKKILNVFLQ